MSGDALEEISELIAALGRCYLCGRRYRAIAPLCEEHTLARALDIGATLRRAVRSARAGAASLGAVADTLRALLAECEAAVEGVRTSDLYRRAARAWEEGRGAETAALAPLIFAGVEPYPQCPTLYHPVAIAERRGAGEHFAPATACAVAIAALAQDGIAAATSTDLGADETIRAVFLSDDPELLESPVALTIEPASLELPACRLAAASDAVLYAARLRVPFRVRCAPAVTDEWWAVRPDAYARYIAELRAELTARAIPLAG